jgi:serine/threonine protein kinase
MTQISYKFVAKLSEHELYAAYRGVAYLPDGQIRDVMIKRLHPEVVQDPVILSHLAGFSDVARGLQHPNLAPLWDLGQCEGHYLLIREYMPGCSLQQLLEQIQKEETILSPSMAVYITQEIAEAIAALHRYRVPGDQLIYLFHGGLSPENIILTRIGGVAVTDAGIDVIFWRDPNLAQQLCARKQSYHPPEYRSGQRPMRRGDPYGVAALLYHMLMGLPIQEASLMWGDGHQIVPPSRHHPRVTENFDQLLLNYLHPNIDLRLVQMEQMRQEITQPSLLRQAPVERREAMAYIEALVEQSGEIKPEHGQLLINGQFLLDSLLPHREELAPPHKRYRPPRYEDTERFHPQSRVQVQTAVTPSKSITIPPNAKTDIPPEPTQISNADIADSQAPIPDAMTSVTPNMLPNIATSITPNLLTNDTSSATPNFMLEAINSATPDMMLNSASAQNPSQQTVASSVPHLKTNQAAETNGWEDISDAMLLETLSHAPENSGNATRPHSPTSFSAPDQLLPPPPELEESLDQNDLIPLEDDEDSASHTINIETSISAYPMPPKELGPDLPKDQDNLQIARASHSSEDINCEVATSNIANSKFQPVSNPIIKLNFEDAITDPDLMEDLEPTDMTQANAPNPLHAKFNIESPNRYDQLHDNSSHRDFSTPNSDESPQAYQQHFYTQGKTPPTPPPQLDDNPPSEFLQQSADLPTKGLPHAQGVAENHYTFEQNKHGNSSPPLSIPPIALPGQAAEVASASQFSVSQQNARSDNYEQFGKFVLINRIAIGGMAEVFRAKIEGIGGFQRIVAVKRILPEFSQDPVFIQMFEDEARIAGALTHPNIVQIHDLGEVEGIHYISMELIDGIDMARVIKIRRTLNQSIPLNVIIEVTIPVCRALHYAHTACNPNGKPLHMIHRDVTPHNIMISKNGEIKLTDFGIAKAAQNIAQTAVGELKGKLSYMSPEQAEGKPIDQRTDIFQLGITMYEMLTLRKMFEGQNDRSILSKIQHGQFPKPRTIAAHIPEPLEQITMRALAVSPAKRYQAAIELENDLHALRQSLPPPQQHCDIAAFTLEILEQRDQLLAEFANRRVSIVLNNDNDVAAHPNLFSDPLRDAIPQDIPLATTRTSFIDKIWQYASQNSRITGIIMILIMLVLGGLVGILALSNRSPKVQYAFFTLHSNPPGADVRLNGNLLGQTPISERKIPFDNKIQKIQFEKPGYLPFTREVKLQYSGQDITINALLQKGIPKTRKNIKQK